MTLSASFIPFSTCVYILKDETYPLAATYGIAMVGLNFGNENWQLQYSSSQLTTIIKRVYSQKVSHSTLKYGYCSHRIAYSS